METTPIQRLRDWVKDSKYSQSDVARALNVSKQVISKWMNDSKDIQIGDNGGALFQYYVCLCRTYWLQCYCCGNAQNTHYVAKHFPPIRITDHVIIRVSQSPVVGLLDGYSLFLCFDD